MDNYAISNIFSESYVWWVIVDIIVPHSSDNLRKIWIDYINELTKVEVGESRSLFCASAVNELMGKCEIKFYFKRVQKKSHVGYRSTNYLSPNTGIILGMAASWLFVDSSFHEDKGKKVFEMLDNIKQAFASMVLRTDWMDQRTKLATLEKNRKMESQIGFPDWLFAENVLNEYYEGVRNCSFSMFKRK